MLPFSSNTINKVSKEKLFEILCNKLDHALVLFVMSFVCEADGINILHTHRTHRINSSQCLCTAKITAYTFTSTTWTGYASLLKYIICFRLFYFIYLSRGKSTITSLRWHRICIISGQKILFIFSLILRLKKTLFWSEI